MNHNEALTRPAHDTRLEQQVRALQKVVERHVATNALLVALLEKRGVLTEEERDALSQVLPNMTSVRPNFGTREFVKTGGVGQSERGGGAPRGWARGPGGGVYEAEALARSAAGLRNPSESRGDSSHECPCWPTGVIAGSPCPDHPPE